MNPEDSKTPENPTTPAEQNNPVEVKPEAKAEGKAEPVKEEGTKPAGVPAEKPIEELKKEAQEVLEKASGQAAAIAMSVVARHNADQVIEKLKEKQTITRGAPSFDISGEERRLEVDLTEADREEKRREVLILLDSKQKNEATLKRLADHYKGEIKNDTNKISEIMEILKYGKEVRPVKVLRFKNFERKTLTILREDNNAVVEVRRLEDGEIPKPVQQDLPFDAKKEAPADNIKKEGVKVPAGSSFTLTTEATRDGSAEIEKKLLQVEKEIAITTEEHNAIPTTGSARKLVALDKEAIGLRVELREALAAEGEASDKKKAEKAAKKAEGKNGKAPEKVEVKEGTKAPAGTPPAELGARVLGGEIRFYAGGVEIAEQASKDIAAQRLALHFVTVSGGAQKLIDKLDTKFSKRTVQRYAAFDSIPSADFLSALIVAFKKPDFEKFKGYYL